MMPWPHPVSVQTDCPSCTRYAPCCLPSTSRKPAKGSELEAPAKSHFPGSSTQMLSCMTQSVELLGLLLLVSNVHGDTHAFA